MGMPLLLIGAAGGKWLPQSGAWMHLINQAFGLLMLAVAIWLLSRILPGQIILTLWSLLSIMTGILIGALDFNAKTLKARLQQGVGFIVLLYGIVMLVGASLGNTHPLRPLENLQSSSAFSVEKNHPSFLLTKSLPETQALITKAAKQQNKPILLDFYANWCTTCQALDAQLFSQPAVINALSHFTLIRADITEQNKAQHALQKHYQVIAPPAMLFFNRQGQLMPEMTLFGYINQKDFLQHLEHMTE
jgi:thiol:disulfide interchange protein DsbD